MPDLSIVIAAYQRPEELRNVLDSIKNCHFEFSHEVICILDGEFSGYINYNLHKSLNGSKCMFLGSQRGQSFAINRGIELSKSDKVFISDDDRIFDVNFFHELYPHIKPGQAAIGRVSKTLSPFDEYVGYGNMYTGFYGVWKEDLYTVGGFDENLGYNWGYADIDMARRLEMLGVKFKFVPSAIIEDLGDNLPYLNNPKTVSHKKKESVANDLYLDGKYLKVWDDIFMAPLEEYEYPNRGAFYNYNEFRFL